MTSYPQRVKLVDVGPRDGLQNEKQPVPAAVKVELVHRLQAAAGDLHRVARVHQRTRAVGQAVGAQHQHVARTQGHELAHVGQQGGGIAFTGPVVFKSDFQLAARPDPREAEGGDRNSHDSLKLRLGEANRAGATHHPHEHGSKPGPARQGSDPPGHPAGGFYAAMAGLLACGSTQWACLPGMWIHSSGLNGPSLAAYSCGGSTGLYRFPS